MVFLPGARSIPSRVWLHGLPATKPWASFDLCAEHIHENHFPKVSWAGNARAPALLPQSLKPPPPAPTWTPSRAHWDTSRRGQSLQKEPQRPLALPLVKDEKLEAQAERWKVNRTQSEARLRSSSPPPPSATPRLLGRRPRSHWAQSRAVPPGPRPRGGRGGAWRGRDGSPSIRRFLQVRSTWCQASSRAVDSRWNGIRCSCTQEIPPKKSGGAICSEQAQHKRAPCFPLRPGEVQSSPTPWSWRQPGCRSTTSQFPGPKRQTLGDAWLCHREP